MATHALATRYRIVLVDYPDDANFTWHMRLLIHHGGGAQWAASTPDHHLQILDLARHRIIPFRSGEELPARARGDAYIFDEFEEGEEDGLMRQARLYAETVGFVAPAAARPAGVWRVSDTAHAMFGEVVPEEALDDEESVVTRDAVGCAYIEDRWVNIERVPDNQLATWRARKGNGPGRDKRVLGTVVDPRGKRFLREEEAARQWSGAPIADTPLQGPSVVLDFFEALMVAGLTLLAYHMNWKQKSGVGEKSAVCREHFFICEQLRVEVTIDQVDLTQLVSSEFRVRRLLQIEAAVERNPRQPDFEGLEVMLTSALNPSGGAVTEKFSEWMTARQRDQAQILKQGRLLREERAAAAKKAAGAKASAEGA